MLPESTGAGSNVLKDSELAASAYTNQRESEHKTPRHRTQNNVPENCKLLKQR
jgi:hypothetical protein